MKENKNFLKDIYFGSVNPIQSIDGKYYYIYKTTNLLNDKIYIGARSVKLKDPFSDRYVGCGITLTMKNTTGGAKNISSPFYQAVIEYGILNFKKDILLFFPNLEYLLLAERLIVNEDFIKLNSNYNKIIGGGLPPVMRGNKNGNFGNYWSLKQKKDLSEKKKKSGVAKKEKNPKAKKCYLYDFLTDINYELKYIREIPEKIGKKLDYNWNSIMSFRYILCNEGEDPYIRAKSLNKSKFVILVIEKFKEGKTIEECVNELKTQGNKTTVLKRTYKKLINESNNN